VLLGYTLHDDAIAPDNPVQIDLYWHVPDTIENNYRPLVQLVNLTQTSAWAVSNPIQPAAGETSNYTPDYFARDPHMLHLNDKDTPPFVGQIMIQIFGENGALTLPDGSDKLLLEPIIRVDTDDAEVRKESDYQLGDVASLYCAAIEQQNNQFIIDLFWHIVDESDRELVVMVHGLDEVGNMIENGDGAPFSGNYPSLYWRKGQTLHERRTLPYNPAIKTITIGLYARDTIERLPITDNGTPVPDNRILFSVNRSTCLP
jgi:hypothetical protein